MLQDRDIEVMITPDPHVNDGIESARTYAPKAARQVAHKLHTKAYIQDAIVANLAERGTARRPLGKLHTSY